VAFSVVGILLARPAQARKPAVAFFYGKPVPVAELRHFDWVVVQPENLDAQGLAELKRARVEVFAYLSMGEAAAHEIEASSIVGSNPGWNSVIVNPASPSWRERVLARADALAERGYRGLFLDTLDSYAAALPGPEARRAAALAMSRLVAALHERHPQLQLFFNRGFEILDEVGRLATALAAESLYFGWDAVRKQYVEVPEADRKWLTAQLRGVKERYGIPVVVIDYVPTARRETARMAARRIDALGFTPWVSNQSLDALGVGSVEVIPRRVLLLYDGAETPSLQQSPIHRLAALPIEYLGFAADYLDVRRGLPPEPLAGRYAGIVTWFTDDELPDALGYPQWLVRQLDAGIRLVMLGRPGFSVTGSFLARLGLGAVVPRRPLRFAERDRVIGFETEPQLRSRALLAWHDTSGGASVHLRLEDADGQPIDAVLTAAWGGFALEPYVVDVGYEGRIRWIVDPFSFLEGALGVGSAPALDLTTENGAPLLVVVADAAASPEGPDAASGTRAILDEVLSAPVAATVTRPADEATPSNRGRKFESPVSAIFALSNVEAADPAVMALSGGNPQFADEPSLAQLSPSGIPSDAGFLVYPPGWNRSGASSWWEAKRFDVEHLVALLERAQTPRRLKALGFYFQLGIATRPAALRSLKDGVRWALNRGALPLWASEYAERVLDFQSASLALTLDGTWQFRGLEHLRTVRLPRSAGWPDLERSRGVAAITDEGEFRYVSFGDDDEPTLVLSDEPPSRPYIAWANATLERWSEDGGDIALRLRGHGPVRFIVDAERSCTLSAHGREVHPTRVAGRDTFSLAQRDTGDARLECGEG
jgi:hypothetical protein